MKKSVDRSVSFKNYIYLLLIIIASLFVMYYIYLWYDTYKKDSLNKDVLGEYLNVINYNEVNSYVFENRNAVIYVSKIGDEGIFKFEKKFKNIIVDNNLRDKVLYLVVDDSSYNTIINEYDVDGNLPFIVVYTDGEVTSVYNISKYKYNTSKIVKYLNRIGVIDNED